MFGDNKKEALFMRLFFPLENFKDVLSGLFGPNVKGDARELEEMQNH